MATSRPNLKLDWTINVGDVLTIITMLIIGLAAYFNLKGDVDKIVVRAEAKFTEYDKLWIIQRDTDEQQNQRTTRAYNELNTNLKEAKTEINLNIRELRADIAGRSNGNISRR